MFTPLCEPDKSISNQAPPPEKSNEAFELTRRCPCVRQPLSVQLILPTAPGSSSRMKSVAGSGQYSTTPDGEGAGAGAGEGDGGGGGELPTVPEVQMLELDPLPQVDFK